MNPSPAEATGSAHPADSAAPTATGSANPAPTVTDLLEHSLARGGEDPAVIVDGGETLSYERLRALSGALAHRLAAAGVGPGARVAVLADRCAWQVIAAVAVLRAGAVYVPVDAGSPPARVAHLLRDADPAALLRARASEATPDHSPAYPGPALNLADPAVRADLKEEARALGGEASPLRRPTGEDPAYIIYTSGTTGEPKGAVNLHRGVALHLRWMGRVFGGGEHVVVNKAPVAFDVGVAEMLSPLITGGTVVLPPAGWWPGDARALLGLVRRHRVSVMSIVPSMMRALLDSGVGSGELGSLRHLLLGGEAVPADLVARVREVTPARVHGLYGPSETAMDVMWVEYTPDLPLRPGQALLGAAEPEVRLRVLEPGGLEEVAPGEIGELAIGGPQVGGGYFRRPELTAAAFLPDPEGGTMYRTGDLVRLDKELGMYEFRGRLGDQVKVRGNRVELGEVEAALRAAPGVRAAAARLVGEELWGYVTGEPDLGQVRAHVAGELPGYAVPGRLVPLAELPLNANGKLDRAALPDRR
ncbi:amino acid adenylation domain-containing protein [Corynebacterium mastitidis]|uniref:amino acid adenylation domain-containing protein n=2 Tax=Corynebacterium mastitidis TaxID=161890 RepID=UPI0030E9D0D8